MQTSPSCASSPPCPLPHHGIVVLPATAMRLPNRARPGPRPRGARACLSVSGSSSRLPPLATQKGPMAASASPPAYRADPRRRRDLAPSGAYDFEVLPAVSCASALTRRQAGRTSLCCTRADTTVQRRVFHSTSAADIDERRGRLTWWSADLSHAPSGRGFRFEGRAVAAYRYHRLFDELVVYNSTQVRHPSAGIVGCGSPSRNAASADCADCGRRLRPPSALVAGKGGDRRRSRRLLEARCIPCAGSRTGSEHFLALHPHRAITSIASLPMPTRAKSAAHRRRADRRRPAPIDWPNGPFLETAWPPNSSRALRHPELTGEYATLRHQQVADRSLSRRRPPVRLLRASNAPSTSGARLGREPLLTVAWYNWSPTRGQCPTRPSTISSSTTATIPATVRLAAEGDRASAVRARQKIGGPSAAHRSWALPAVRADGHGCANG